MSEKLIDEWAIKAHTDIDSRRRDQYEQRVKIARHPRLGNVPDPSIASDIGCSTSVISVVRNLLNIPCAAKKVFLVREAHEDGIINLEVDTHKDVSETLGFSVSSSVCTDARKRLGLISERYLREKLTVTEIENRERSELLRTWR